MPEESKGTDVGAGSPSKESGTATKKQGQAGKVFAPRAPKFEGRCVDLKGHIYDCSDVRQSDQYTKTTKEIAEYVGRTYKYGGDTRLAIENDLTLPTFTPPADYADDAGRSEIRIWEKLIDEHVRRISYLGENIKTLYSLVWGQCSDIMRQKLEAHPTYTAVFRSGDGLGLLKAIKGIAFQFQSQKYLSHALHESLKRYYNCAQGKFATTQAYLEHFQNVVAVVLQSGGAIAGHPGVEAAIIEERGLARDKLTEIELASITEEVTARSTAMAFLLGCDRSRCGRLIEDLENDFLQGRNNYPTTVAAAYNLITNWKQERNGWRPGTTDGVAFANVDDKKPRTGKGHITCHKCEKKGHYASECPDLAKNAGNNPTETGAVLLHAGIAGGEFDAENHFQFLQNGVTCQIGQDGRLPKSWILLDNQSTIDVFYNSALLSNIRTGTGTMDIHCNAGVATTNMVGDFAGYGTVWYHPDGIANILSLSRVKEHGYRVTYDSHEGNRFIVHKPDGGRRTFEESERGLYYLDTTGDNEDGVVMLDTVANNRTSYTNRAYSRAILARNIQKIIGRPSMKDYINIVERNLLPNCPVTKNDIIAAEKIFGPDIGSLKGKTVRRNTSHVECATVPVPAELMSMYRDVVLGADIMFVNKLPFFVTISRNIKFTTAVLLLDQKHGTLIKTIRDVQRIYKKRGFRINTMLMDGQFDGLAADLADLGITLNTVARGEHVPEVERHIRTIKERARSVYNMLPFDKIPGRMVAELVYYSVFWLNSFPVRDGISDTLSPRSIVDGTHIDFHKHCKLEFGTYVQAHEEHDNTMVTRTVGALALRPTGNAQGSYFLYSLDSGRVLNRSHWTALPMPHDVIDRVHKLARRSAANAALLFADRNGNIVPDDDGDSDDDEEYLPGQDDADSYDDNQSFDGDDADDHDDDDAPDYDDRIAGVAGYYPQVDIEIPQVPHMDVDLMAAPANDAHHIAPLDNAEEVLDPVDIEQTDNEFEDVVETDQTDDDANESNDLDNNIVNAADERGLVDVNIEDDGAVDVDVDVEAEMDAQYGQRTSGYNLRARKPRDYSHMHTTLEHTVFTQHSMKRGIKEFGDAGVNAVLKELKQLHDRSVLEPKSPNDLSREDRRAALQYLMFLKKKRDGTIKGRGCADGRKQRSTTTKEEASSPTVAIEAVMLSCVIDAMEQRDVATVDIPGAFMQAEMDELVHMKLEGKMAELLVRIDPKLYRKHVQDENGKQVLYVELKKALYGTLRAALLFWRRLSSQLAKWDFTPNPYDPCVMNKTINGHQCTILWHVDDLKISHVDPEVVTEMIDLLEAEFGKEAPLTKTRGKVHEYLGMTIDFSTAGKVRFSMIDYIQNMLDELPDDMDGEAATPAANHLFEVNTDSPKLTPALADLFHHNTAKLLFLCKRARPDVQTSVAFLCTRVKSPDDDDYKKLSRVMKYLRGTINTPLTLESDGTNIIKWWADAAYAVHADMKSHTGGALTLGRGVIYGTSTRQKLNTKSSTEAELVGVNDVMPQVLWTRYFLEAQGINVSDSVVFQDNQSAILLEKNGRASSSKRTRHINIRYFFVTDRIANNEVSVHYCPTKEMLADYFTKPLQGSHFKILRDRIMNINPDTVLCQDYRSVLCVAEAEPRTDDGWTTVVTKKSKMRSPQSMKSTTRLGLSKTKAVPSVIGNSGHMNDNLSVLNEPIHMRERKHDRGNDREWRKENVRLEWDID